MLGGRRLLDHARGPLLQRALGVVMVLTALAVATDADVRFQTALADHFPSVVVNPTGSLERSDAVEKRLAELRGRRSRFEAHAATKGGQLPVLGVAPDFTGTQRWFNCEPLTLERLRGRVVLVDFWTYTCINCIRTFPYLRAWDAAYRSRGLTIVGVHTPEFSFERDAGNVRDAIAQSRLRYPVAQDNDYRTWNAWGNQLLAGEVSDRRRGRVRYAHFGEGDDDKTEAAIRSLLAGGRRGAAGRRCARRRHREGRAPRRPRDLPRLGARRGLAALAAARNGTRIYDAPRGRLTESRFALDGALASRRRGVRRGGARRLARGQRRRQGRLPRAQLTRRDAAPAPRRARRPPDPRRGRRAPTSTTGR